MNKGFFLSVLITTACTIKVKTYEKPGQSFDNFNTWCWLRGCEVTYQGPDYLYDQKVIDEIANAIAFNMYQKGYQQGDDQSNLLVNFFTIVKEDSSEIIDSYDGFMPEVGWMNQLYPKYQKYLKGSLVIDVIDRESSTLIWRSHAIKYMEINPMYEKREIWKGVNKAMRKLPEVKFE